MAEVTRSTSPDLAKYGLIKGLALTRLSGGDAFKMIQRNGPSAGLAWRRDRSLFLRRLSRRNVRMPGKTGINHATPLHRMEAMRLYLSASVS
jgi:hypothetical protein